MEQMRTRPGYFVGKAFAFCFLFCSHNLFVDGNKGKKINRI